MVLIFSLVCGAENKPAFPQKTTKRSFRKPAVPHKVQTIKQQNLRRYFFTLNPEARKEILQPQLWSIAAALEAKKTGQISSENLQSQLWSIAAALHQRQKTKESLLLSVSEYRKLSRSVQRKYIREVRKAYLQFELLLGYRLQAGRKKQALLPWHFFSDLFSPIPFAEAADYSNKCLIGGVMRSRTALGKCSVYGRSCGGKKSSFKCGVAFNNVCIPIQPINDLSERCFQAAKDKPLNTAGYKQFKNFYENTIPEFCQTNNSPPSCGLLQEKLKKIKSQVSSPSEAKSPPQAATTSTSDDTQKTEAAAPCMEGDCLSNTGGVLADVKELANVVLSEDGCASGVSEKSSEVSNMCECLYAPIRKKPKSKNPRARRYSFRVSKELSHTCPKPADCGDHGEPSLVSRLGGIATHIFGLISLYSNPTSMCNCKFKSDYGKYELNTTYSYLPPDEAEKKCLSKEESKQKCLSLGRKWKDDTNECNKCPRPIWYENNIEQMPLDMTDNSYNWSALFGGRDKSYVISRYQEMAKDNKDLPKLPLPEITFINDDGSCRNLKEVKSIYDQWVSVRDQLKKICVKDNYIWDVYFNECQSPDYLEFEKNLCFRGANKKDHVWDIEKRKCYIKNTLSNKNPEAFLSAEQVEKTTYSSHIEAVKAECIKNNYVWKVNSGRCLTPDYFGQKRKKCFAEKKVWKVNERECHPKSHSHLVTSDWFLRSEPSLPNVSNTKTSPQQPQRTQPSQSAIRTQPTPVTPQQPERAPSKTQKKGFWEKLSSKENIPKNPDTGERYKSWQEYHNDRARREMENSK